MEQENDHTNGDGAVRHVECGPVQIANVDIQEVHHFSKTQAVDEIADGSPENQRQRESKKGWDLGVWW